MKQNMALVVVLEGLIGAAAPAAQALPLTGAAALARVAATDADLLPRKALALPGGAQQRQGPAPGAQLFAPRLASGTRATQALATQKLEARALQKAGAVAQPATARKIPKIPVFTEGEIIRSLPKKFHKVQKVVEQVRCSDQRLSAAEATRRAHWFVDCNPVLVREYMRLLLDDPRITVGEARGYYYQMMDFHDPDGDDTWSPVKPNNVGYPVFTTADLTDIWEDVPETCVGIPEGYVWGLFCISGCYTPEMQLAFPEGYSEIGEAFESAGEVVVLDEEATLEDPSFTLMPVASYTRSRVDTSHEIVEIRTESGGLLRLTPNHPLVDSAGYIREAADFNVGEALVEVDGELDAIASIATVEYFGKVYNLSVASEQPLHNVVVAEGYLSGSGWYQNEASDRLNSQLLRAGIPEEILE